MQKKLIFVAYAARDAIKLDMLTVQSLNTRSPFEYVAMPDKGACSCEWRQEARSLIRRSHGVIALVSRNSLDSSGLHWEIDCAREEQKPMLGIWAYHFDKTKLPGVTSETWDQDTIEKYIDVL